jgi:hypothetical protein
VLLEWEQHEILDDLECLIPVIGLIVDLIVDIDDGLE